MAVIEVLDSGLGLGVDIWRVVLLFTLYGLVSLVTIKAQLHPFLALVIASALYGVSVALGGAQTLAAMRDGFGSVMSSVGLPVTAAMVIGTFLTRSGATHAAVRIAGPRIPSVAALSLTTTLFNLVFGALVDVHFAFALWLPFLHALALRFGSSLTTTTLSNAFALTATSALLVPAPGPVAAALVLDVNLALLFGLGVPLSLAFACLGWLWVHFVVSLKFVDPQSVAFASLDYGRDGGGGGTSFFGRDGRSSLSVVSLAMWIPLALMGVGAIVQSFLTSWLRDALSFVGHPMIASMFGVLIAAALSLTRDRSYASLIHRSPTSLLLTSSSLVQ